jgi:hypothetical protein
MMQPQVVLQQQQQNKPTARREMSGPTGVDDILKTFDEVRRAEAMAANSVQPATGVLTQPAVAAVMSSSMSTDDVQSQAGSTMTGATGGRSKRRKAQPPVGNVFSLAV